MSYKRYKLNITSGVLDTLGFTEYWDEHGTWGGRTLHFSNGTSFRIIEQEEMYDELGQYIAHHYYFANWFAIPKINDIIHHHIDLFFLHEMYDLIKKIYPDCLDEFTKICKESGMSVYLTKQIEKL